MGKKLLVIQVAGLRHKFDWPGVTFHALETVFPAVTCTAQATFRTGLLPGGHGMVGNGIYCRRLHRPMFWEQSADLVAGERIWDDFRRRGGRVGMLFWQQSLGERADVILSPAPIHKHHGGMIQDCYCRPAGLYQTLCAAVGRKFNLMHYWGPLASDKAGLWILDATRAVLCDPATAPDLCLTYVPTLDYDLQRKGPVAEAAILARLEGPLKHLADSARGLGYDVLLFGDYAIGAVTAAAYPNRSLMAAGLLRAREVAGMLYPDFHASRAFAVVDHEIAHVYVRDSDDLGPTRDALASTDGVAQVLDRDAQEQRGVRHDNGGELLAVVAEGRWLAYPWWSDAAQEPDYARHVDIHNKPGYDPCELFFGWPPMSVSRNTARIRGSHGRVGPGREVVFGSTIEFASPPRTLIELSQAVKNWLDD